MNAPDPSPSLSEALTTLADAFGTDATLDAPTLDDVRAFLIPRIQALLDRQPGLLMHILYRVDVAETAAKDALASPDPAPRLADLLIERQLQKMHLRRTYGARNR